MGDPKICVYQLVYNEKDKNDTQITQYLLYMDWDYVSS